MRIKGSACSDAWMWHTPQYDIIGTLTAAVIGEVVWHAAERAGPMIALGRLAPLTILLLAICRICPAEYSPVEPES